MNISINGISIKKGDVFEHFGYGYMLIIESAKHVEYKGKRWIRVYGYINGVEHMISDQALYEDYDKKEAMRTHTEGNANH